MKRRIQYRGRPLRTRHGREPGTDSGHYADRAYYCGYIIGTEDLGLGTVSSSSNRGFVLAFDLSGSPIVQRTWETHTSEGACAAVAIDSAGRIFMAGTMYGTTDLGGGPRTVSRSSAFFARYDPDLSHRSDGVITGEGDVQAYGADIGPADGHRGHAQRNGGLGQRPRSSAGESDGFILRFAN